MPIGCASVGLPGGVMSGFDGQVLVSSLLADRVEDGRDGSFGPSGPGEISWLRALSGAVLAGLGWRLRCACAFRGSVAVAGGSLAGVADALSPEQAKDLVSSSRAIGIGHVPILAASALPGKHPPSSAQRARPPGNLQPGGWATAQ